MPMPNQNVFTAQINDLHISTVLDSGFANEGSFDPKIHSHSFYEIFIGMEGSFYIEFTASERIHMSPGSACLIPSGIYHCAHKISANAKKLAVRFKYTRDFQPHLSASTYQLCHTALQNCRKPILIQDCTQLYEIVKNLQTELRCERFASEIYIQTLLEQFYIHFFRVFFFRNACEKKNDASLNVSSDNERQMIIDDYLCAHYADSITAQDLAQVLNMSRRQLDRVLQDIYTKSFRQLLIETRLHRAAQLLMETDHAVEDIAYMVGYSATSGFYSAFLKEFGVSAGKYRREFK